jgi:hypothetical protein
MLYVAVFAGLELTDFPVIEVTDNIFGAAI